MYRIDDMATWREYRRDLLREAEEVRLARHVNEARPKWGQTLTGKVRRGASLLLSMVGRASPGAHTCRNSSAPTFPGENHSPSTHPSSCCCALACENDVMSPKVDEIHPFKPDGPMMRW